MDLNTRTTGSYGLSVSTSIAFETMFGKNSDSYDIERIGDSLDISNYERCYINIYLLIRNIITSYEKYIVEIILNSSVSIINNIILSEIENIESIFRNRNCELVWLIPDYNKAKITLFRKGKLNIKSRIYFKSIDIVKQLKKKINELGNILEDLKIESSDKDILILTHISMDLLNFKRCKKLTLVETSTGHIIEKIDFNKKYHSSKKYNKFMLPYNEILLRILGDGFLIDTVRNDSKNIINEIALKYKWNRLTTEDKVRINLLLDSDGKDLLNSISHLIVY